jgi:hypothetical protein
MALHFLKGALESQLPRVIEIQYGNITTAHSAPDSVRADAYKYN